MVGIPRVYNSGVYRGVHTGIPVVYTAGVHREAYPRERGNSAQRGSSLKREITLRREALSLRERDNSVQRASLPKENRATLRREPLFLRLFPFHCWLIFLLPCATTLSVAGLLVLSARFTVGLIPVSLLEKSSPSSFPVSLLASSLRPCALSFLNLNIQDSRDVRKHLRINIPGMSETWDRQVLGMPQE